MDTGIPPGRGSAPRVVMDDAAMSPAVLDETRGTRTWKASVIGMLPAAKAAARDQPPVGVP